MQQRKPVTSLILTIGVVKYALWINNNFKKKEKSQEKKKQKQKNNNGKTDDLEMTINVTLNLSRPVPGCTLGAGL